MAQLATELSILLVLKAVDELSDETTNTFAEEEQIAQITGFLARDIRDYLEILYRREKLLLIRKSQGLQAQTTAVGRISLRDPAFSITPPQPLIQITGSQNVLVNVNSNVTNSTQSIQPSVGTNTSGTTQPWLPSPEVVPLRPSLPPFISNSNPPDIGSTPIDVSEINELTRNHVTESALTMVENSRVFFREALIEELSVTQIDLSLIQSKLEIVLQQCEHEDGDLKLGLSLLDEIEDIFREIAGLPLKFTVSLKLGKVFFLVGWCLEESIFDIRALLLETIPQMKKARMDADLILEALSILSFTYTSQGEKTDWTQATKIQLEILKLLDGMNDPARRALELSTLSTCLHSKTRPEWQAALAAVDESLEYFSAHTDATKLPYVLSQKAWILLYMPEPQVQAAKQYYEDAVEVLSKTGRTVFQAEMLACLTDCLLNHHNPPLWAEATARLEQATQLLISIHHEEALDYIDDLFNLYLSLPIPDLSKAAQICEIALTLPINDATAKWALYHNWAGCLDIENPQVISEATTVAKNALKFARKSGNPTSIAISLQMLGYLLLGNNHSSPDKAISVYLELLGLLDQEQEPIEYAAALHNIAFCYLNQKRPNATKAYDFAAQSLSVLRAIENHQNIPAFKFTLLLAAIICQHLPTPDIRAATEYYLEAVDCLKSPVDRLDLALTLNHLSYISYAFEPQNIDFARKMSQEAVRIFRKEYANMYDPVEKLHIAEMLANTLGQQASLYLLEPQPNFSKTALLFRQSLEYLTAPEQTKQRGEFLFHLAHALWLRPSPDKVAARLCLEQGAECLRTSGDKVTLPHVLSELALLNLDSGLQNWRECAIPLCQEADSLFDAETDVFPKARNLQLLGICQKNKEQMASIQAFERSIQLLEQHVDVLDQEGHDLLNDTKAMLNETYLTTNAKG